MKEFAPLRLDSNNQCLWRIGNAGREQRILLTPKAIAVLVYLVEHAGQLVTHDELLETVIETVPKRGYRFIAPVSERIAPSPAVPEIATQSRLVGRGPALNELHDRLHHAARGERQIPFITGEARIGKTALVDEFRRQVAQDAQECREALAQTRKIDDLSALAPRSHRAQLHPVGVRPRRDVCQDNNSRDDSPHHLARPAVLCDAIGYSKHHCDDSTRRSG
jgi:hypothetical protein